MAPTIRIGGGRDDLPKFEIDPEQRHQPGTRRCRRIKRGQIAVMVARLDLGRDKAVEIDPGQVCSGGPDPERAQLVAIQVAEIGAIERLRPFIAANPGRPSPPPAAIAAANMASTLARVSSAIDIIVPLPTVAGWPS
ncbi:MAG: hypothetical protein U5N85_02970 [Arcicella sp.]|nr:hypothetical protein [Arcicella sp.]